MPRKPKTNLFEENAKNNILKECYTDSFNIKTTSARIINNISTNIDYFNKQEVLNTLPLLQKQMDIFLEANKTILEIQSKIND